MGKSEKPELTHDRLADRFDEIMNDYDLQRRLEVLIDDFLGEYDLEGKFTLVVGPGTGHGSQKLRERGAKVIAIDIGLNLLKRARVRSGCRVIHSNVLDLPFASEVFDVVFSSEVIEHTPSPLDAVREMHRVLKPKGRLALSTPGWLWQWPVRLASMLGLRQYDGLENFVKADDLRRACESANGIVIEHKGIHILPFQISFLHPFLRFMDLFGETLLPLMINQCIQCEKSV